MKYVPVRIEAVYPDGEVRVLNAFVTENAAVRGEDPAWPREKLIEHAQYVMGRWYDTYGFNLPTLRLAK